MSLSPKQSYYEIKKQKLEENQRQNRLFATNTNSYIRYLAIIKQKYPDEYDNFVNFNLPKLADYEKEYLELVIKASSTRKGRSLLQLTGDDLINFLVIQKMNLEDLAGMNRDIIHAYHELLLQLQGTNRHFQRLLITTTNAARTFDNVMQVLNDKTNVEDEAIYLHVKQYLPQEIIAKEESQSKFEEQKSESKFDTKMEAAMTKAKANLISETKIQSTISKIQKFKKIL